MAKLLDFEQCVFCPKLCRHACPVALVSGKESGTPTAMMTAYWAQKKGLLTKEQALSSIDMCTQCGACSQACKYNQPVPDLLFFAAQKLKTTKPVPSLPSIQGEGELLALAPDFRDWSRMLQKTIEKSVCIAFCQSLLGMDFTNFPVKRLRNALQSWAKGRTIISVTKKTTQLAKIADQDHGGIAESVFGGIQSCFAEVTTLALMHSVMHPGEESAADEGDLIHDQEFYVAPRALQAPQSISFQLALPRGFREDLEGRTRRFCAEADVESCNTRVRRKLDLGIHAFSLKRFRCDSAWSL